MGKVVQEIEVDVPVTTAYNQWTQFEEFPKFMEGVKEVRQLDDKTLQWTAEIAGKEEKWTAEIGEQQPDERVTWHSTSSHGPQNAGTVLFERLGDSRTRVKLIMEWQPRDLAEKVGDALAFDDRRVRGDLERFKEFVESRGAETGAWRGEIAHGERVR